MDPGDNTTLQAVLERFESDGYVGQMLVTREGALRCTACGTTHDAGSVHAEQLRRMEGTSDPADMLAVVGTTCPGCGGKATLVLGYGPEASAEEADTLALLDSGAP